MAILQAIAAVFKFFTELVGWRQRAEDREAGATAEREQINTKNAEIQQRRSEVAKKPVSEDELQKSLKDGSF